MPTTKFRILQMLFEYAINSRVIHETTGTGHQKSYDGFFFASAGYFLGLLRVYDFFIQFLLARRTSPPNPQ